MDNDKRAEQLKCLAHVLRTLQAAYTERGLHTEPRQLGVIACDFEELADIILGNAPARKSELPCDESSFIRVVSAMGDICLECSSRKMALSLGGASLLADELLQAVDAAAEFIDGSP